MNKLIRVLYILFCLQGGIFLLVFPWLRLWESHTLLVQYPVVRPLMMNNFFRGAVSGLGIVNVVIGSIEVMNLGRKRDLK
ncbi:MAG: hypothetical protein HY644_11695 [Acidobacteria bacterium]|nr:hypothetical protein [Acidobacteriota bacterium]